MTIIRQSVSEVAERDAEHDMKCTFMPGIASMSGTLAKNQNSILVAKRCRGDKPGHGRVYIMPRKSFERTRFTPNEVEAKKRFTSVQNMLTNLSPEQWKSYEKEFRCCGGRYNSKVYKSVRTYTFARLMYQLRHGVIKTESSETNEKLR